MPQRHANRKRQTARHNPRYARACVPNSASLNNFEGNLKSVSGVGDPTLAPSLECYSRMQGLHDAIALLELLSTEPAPPHSNALTDYRPERCDPTMSIEHERKIVSCLVSITAFTDDPERVSALCLERDSKRCSCTIRVAMNTGVPEKLMVEFRKVARALEKAHHTGKSESKPQVIPHVYIMLRQAKRLGSVNY